MSYFVLSRNGEVSFNKFLSPNPDLDPDHLRSQLEKCILRNACSQTNRQTDLNALPSHSYPGARVITMLINTREGGG